MRRNLNDCLKERENNFDLIRLLAAIAVIFSHSYDLTPGGQEPIRLFSNGGGTLGGISVCVFFVISGLLITKSFATSKNLVQYFSARALRIYPALIVVILTTAFIIGPLFTTLPLKQYFASGQTWLYLTNIPALRIRQSLPGLFEYNFYGNPVNGSLWTLPHEILCYLIVACIGCLVLKNKFQFLVTAFIVIAIVFFNAHIFLTFKFLNNLIFFLCGSVMYLCRKKIKLSYTVAGICFVAYLFAIRFVHGSIFPVFIYGALLSYITVTIAFANIGALKVITSKGDFSYGIYIWAWPVQQILVLRYPALNHFANFFFALIICIVISALSWHFVEKKALKLKRMFKPVKTLNQPDTIIVLAPQLTPIQQGESI
ncbi:MAG TPA: acyltransferase [Chitinophagaceae bacterium]|nr:acyltransferase [Chitinophagaceae bacterium]